MKNVIWYLVVFTAELVWIPLRTIQNISKFYTHYLELKTWRSNKIERFRKNTRWNFTRYYCKWYLYVLWTTQKMYSHLFGMWKKVKRMKPNFEIIIRLRCGKCNVYLGKNPPLECPRCSTTIDEILKFPKPEPVYTKRLEEYSHFG